MKRIRRHIYYIEQIKKVDKEVEEILHRVEFDFIKQSLLHDLGTENG